MRNCDWSSDVGSSDLLLVRLGQHGDALGEVDPAELPALLVHMMDEVAVRPPAGGHPRLAIYGLIEARLQRADLMILGSLNDGVRSEERRVGEECGSTGRFRGSAYP